LLACLPPAGRVIYEAGFLSGWLSAPLLQDPHPQGWRG